MGGFNNPILSGDGTLIRSNEKSPNYVPGVAGWSINKDGSADLANVTVRGTVTAATLSAASIGGATIVGSDFQGGTMEETAITFDSGGGKLLVYTTTTVTSTFATSGTFTVPAGVTALKVECWGGGGGGAGGASGAGGGGGGEYAAETNLAVTAGTSYPYTVGNGGAGGNIGGGNGTSSRFAGVSVTVSAGGGGGGGGGGGTGSTNAIHFNGGGGGGGGGSIGGGGGGSGGTSTAGNAGSSGGAGGAAVSGGGSGGNGSSGNGTAGFSPGGGGGGGGAGGAGAKGQVRVTYVSAQTLIGAVSGVAGTDAMGNTYPAGFMGKMVAVTPGSSPQTPETWHGMTLQNAWVNLGGANPLASYRMVASPANCVQITGSIQSGTTAAASVTIAQLPAGYWPTTNQHFPIMLVGAANIAGTEGFVDTTGAVRVTATTGATRIDFLATIPLDI